ncbi:arsenite methyltransferase [Candidatus Nitrosocosmicus sp. SS]|jgi:ubiquinone/menaquinone biosynthesis C-methylase UbiE|uniref:arsenite methyltransferase n=1 Tax=Candidatus Nitrosocosmicus agrestis TaxID=2563600 RepID=UPI00122E1F00|nr:arsenite methyltransferase [Candidatus Nitrosocosmicus sp. SS]KAA2283537.1 arsenite methyltransferase [Candidatus Nitrosocosmicus sp. SS]KAF0869618.1 arsenite methyltransferase [Candidatus Nitrosocosmicus sp. SS]
MDKQLHLKEKIKEQYGKIAVDGNSNSCCMPSSDCCSTSSEVVLTPFESSKAVGYESDKLKLVPESSVLGVGCGNPTRFADIGEGDSVVDLGSGAGIDVFLAANIVKERGKVIGIDMTENMLKKARENAKKHGYTNVEFRHGDIEQSIPVEDNSVDLVISNCVINLTTNKVNTFREVYRILKSGGKGKMIISDLITSKEIDEDLVNTENWCSCIDGALTKENYLDSIKKAGFTNIEILDEKLYMELEDKTGLEKRKISSISIRAVKE